MGEAAYPLEPRPFYQSPDNPNGAAGTWVIVSHSPDLNGAAGFGVFLLGFDLIFLCYVHTPSFCNWSVYSVRLHVGTM